MDWKRIIGVFAPTLASALPGPLAGMAREFIAQKLGLADAEPKTIDTALQNLNSADLLKLKQAELDFGAKMKELDINLEQLAAADRDSARNRQVAMKDHTPTVIGGGVMLAFLAAQWFVFTTPIPPDSKEVAMMTIGSLNTLAGVIVAYYFGSSSGSAEKSKTIASVAEGKE